jgi:hypothetical protein
VVLPNFANFFILANVLLGVGTLDSCVGMFPRTEGGIKVLAGLAPSSQTVGSLLRTPWLAKSARNIWQKCESSEITPMGKIPSTSFDRMNLAFSFFDKVGFYLSH